MSVYGNIDISYERISTKSHSIKKELQINGEINFKNIDPNSSWYKIRKQLIATFGEHIDKAWFSKLKVEEDNNTNTLLLIAPSPFYRDWISNRYLDKIKQCCTQLDLQLNQIIVR